MNSVEHVRVGPYTFPRTSHPIIREELIVRAAVARWLQAPTLQRAIEEVVGRLLIQKEINNNNNNSEIDEEEMIEQYVEEALAQLDVNMMKYYHEEEEELLSHNMNNNTSKNNNNNNKYYYSDDYSPSVSTSLLSGTPMKNKKVMNSNKGILNKGVKDTPLNFSPNVKEESSIYGRKDIISLSPVPFVQIHKLRATKNPTKILKQNHNQKQKQNSNKDYNSNGIVSIAPIAVTPRHFIPNSEQTEEEEYKYKYEKEELGLENIMTMPPLIPIKERKKQQQQQQQQQKSLLILPHNLTETPNLKDEVRSYFYSLLSLRLEEIGGVQLEEMNLRGNASQQLIRLQGAELSSLTRDAFGVLDVTLDGNSCAIHCRSKNNIPSILQQSHAQQAEKLIELPPSVLRQRTMNTLSRLNKNNNNNSFKRRNEHWSVKGASLKHSWSTAVKANCNTSVEASTQLELPSVTYRSRVLNSIYKKKSTNSKDVI